MGKLSTALSSEYIVLVVDSDYKVLSDNEHRYSDESAERLYVPRNVWKYES